MKRYLNLMDKNTLVALIAGKQYYEDLLTEWKQHHREELVEGLNPAVEALSYTINTILSTLDPDEITRLKKHGRNVHMTIQTRREAIEETKRRIEEDKTTIIPTAHFTEIVSYCLDRCMRCTKSDFASCDLRSLLMLYDIEAFKTDMAEPGCQYQAREFVETAMYDLVENAEGFLFKVHVGFVPPGFKVKHTAPIPEEYWSLPILE